MPNETPGLRPVSRTTAPHPQPPVSPVVSPEVKSSIVAIDQRISKTKQVIEGLDRSLGKVNAKAEEIKSQLLKAMGALEMLEDMKREAVENASQSPQNSGGVPVPVAPSQSPDGAEGASGEGSEGAEGEDSER